MAFPYYKYRKTIRYTQWGFFAFVLALITFILLGVSFETIHQDSMGLVHNKITKRVQRQVLYQGKHHVWPGNEIIQFKRRFITVEFNSKGDLQKGEAYDPLFCLTKDGLYNTVSISAQYQLFPDKLYSILFDYGLQPQMDVYVRKVLWDSIRKVCQKYYAEDFFLARGAIERDMLVEAQDDFLKKGVYASLGFVQLKNVDLPADFVKSINSKQLALQDQAKANNEREGLLVDATTSLKIAQQNANIAVISARGGADGILLQARQKALQIVTQGQSIATAFSIVKTRLNLSPAEFVSYLEAELLKTAPSATISMN